MKKLILSLALTITIGGLNAQNYDDFVTKTGKNLRITFIGHGTLMFQYDGITIHLDPWANLANYDSLPKADYIMITHHHRDHLDSIALSKIFTPTTKLYWTKLCEKQSRFKAGGKVVANGDTIVTPHFRFTAVPAYNIINKRSNGEPFHPKGEGNGYIFEFENLRIYVAGDTENIPEMQGFGKIDIAFLPANLPFTMSTEMFKSAVLTLKPRILYPYHTGNTNLQELTDILKDIKNVEIRFRQLK